ncbi:MAG: sulfite exporter TauE/SafE family protein [Patescibacteria group bacterium]
MKKISFKIEGIHCKSCKILIETEVDVLEGVKDIEVDYQNNDCVVNFDDQKISFSKIKRKIESLNYQIDTSVEELPEKGAVEEKEKKDKTKLKTNNVFQFIKGFLLPLVIIGIIIGYFFVQNFNGFEVLSRLNESNLSYWLILFIGILASFHCVGMCGGLVVTYSARAVAKNKEKAIGFSKMHIQYNVGRFISYTVVGGILGGIGSFFGINPNFSGAVMLLAGIFMLIMAVSLFTKFKWLEKFNFRMPQFIARFLYSERHNKKPKEPLVIGLLNGFMPCGPLQAMQLYALGTGSFSRGALSMAVYALGTIPLMFGFGAFISTLSQKYIGKVMKISAIVVAVLGLIMINRGLSNFGYGIRGFIPSGAASQTEYLVTGDAEEFQIVNMDLTYRGYSPNVLFIKKDIPVRWIINVKQMSGCTNSILIESLGIKKDLEYGENIIEFTPPKNAGEIKFSCWMRMVWGKFVVSKGEISPEQKRQEEESINLPQGTCSGSGSCEGNCGQVTCGCGSRSN